MERRNLRPSLRDGASLHRNQALRASLLKFGHSQRAKTLGTIALKQYGGREPSTRTSTIPERKRLEDWRGARFVGMNTARSSELDQSIDANKSRIERKTASPTSQSFRNRPRPRARTRFPFPTNEPVPRAKPGRHFVPGYDRTVPPGHFATGSSSVLTFGIKMTYSVRLLRSLSHRVHKQLPCAVRNILG